MQSPFLDVAALFSAAVRTGLFGAGMLWQCLEPIWVGLLLGYKMHLLAAQFGLGMVYYCSTFYGRVQRNQN